MSQNRVYSLPEFKEPEKKSSWEELPKEAPVAMRDVELDKARRRTELVRERMSPPGALKLPPLLELMRLRHLIPDGAFRSQASFDRIFVFPLDPFDDAEKIPGSFLYRANLTKLKDMQEGHRGVLISAGLTASDRLASHGIELGHVVTTNKNVPFARRCELIEQEAVFYLVMRDGDLAGSETLAEELRAGTKQIVDAGGDDGYCHQLGGKKKQSVYINDAW
jgi:hypothetical protein